MSNVTTVFGWRGVVRANLNAAVTALARLAAKQASLPVGHFPLIGNNVIVGGTVTTAQCLAALEAELARQLELQVALQETNP